MAPQLIISSVTSKTQDENLTNSGSNILVSGPLGQRCCDAYVGLNEVLDIMDSVNLNDVSLYSADFEFLINPNRDKKHRFIGIVSNIPDFPAKVIFSTNQICADRQIYDDKPCIIGEKQ